MESLHGALMVPHTWPDPAMDNRLTQTMKRITCEDHFVAFDDDDLFDTDFEEYVMLRVTQ
jgi:hypothetical protein